MKQDELLTIGALIAGGYVVYKLSKPLEETGAAVGQVAGAVGSTAESFSGAVSSGLNIFEQGFGVLGDALAGLRQDSADQFQALQEQIYKEGIYKGREESSNYYTIEDINKRQSAFNLLVSTPSGAATVEALNKEQQERGVELAKAIDTYSKSSSSSSSKKALDTAISSSKTKAALAAPVQVKVNETKATIAPTVLTEIKKNPIAAAAFGVKIPKLI